MTHGQRVWLWGVVVFAVLVLSMSAQAGSAWVIDPGKSYGPYRLGMSVREVGTLLKWPNARITEAETAASSTTLLIRPRHQPSQQPSTLVARALESGKTLTVNEAAVVMVAWITSRARRPGTKETS